MKIGNYKLYSIVTSQFSLDGGAMFGIIPKVIWEKEASADQLNRINMVTRSLLLIGNGRNIIIDTGNGDKWDKKYKSIYNIRLDKVNLNNSLSKVGLSPDNITDVICTHLHFDHAGGNTTYNNDQIVPTFPNAQYWVHKDNWDLANSPTEKDKGSYLEENWKVLAQNSMIKFINGKSDIFLGIDLFISNGHTTGMAHPIIKDSSKTVFYAADMFPMACHIPLNWIMAYDINPIQTIKEKKYLLSKIVDENWIIFFEHDPIRQAGTVKEKNGIYDLKETVLISE